MPVRHRCVTGLIQGAAPDLGMTKPLMPFMFQKRMSLCWKESHTCIKGERANHRYQPFSLIVVPQNVYHQTVWLAQKPHVEGDLASPVRTDTDTPERPLHPKPKSGSG